MWFMNDHVALVFGRTSKKVPVSLHTPAFIKVWSMYLHLESLQVLVKNTKLSLCSALLSFSLWNWSLEIYILISNYIDFFLIN